MLQWGFYGSNVLKLYVMFHRFKDVNIVKGNYFLPAISTAVNLS